MSDLNIAGILLSPRPKCVWRILLNLPGKIILMNVASSIVFYEWTVKRSLKNYWLVFSCVQALLSLSSPFYHALLFVFHGLNLL